MFKNLAAKSLTSSTLLQAANHSWAEYWANARVHTNTFSKPNIFISLKMLQKFHVHTTVFISCSPIHMKIQKRYSQTCATLNNSPMWTGTAVMWQVFHWHHSKHLWSPPSPLIRFHYFQNISFSMRFRKPPLWKSFSNTSKPLQCFSVDGRHRKRCIFRWNILVWPKYRHAFKLMVTKKESKGDRLHL